MIGTGELIVILCVVVLLFGGKRLPELARGLGLGLREFKKAFHGLDDGEPQEKSTKSSVDSVIIDIEPESKTTSKGKTE